MDPVNFSAEDYDIFNRRKEMIQELLMNNALISDIQGHTEHMFMNLKNITNSGPFLRTYSEVSSTLLKYICLMRGINCKLETVLRKEIKKWNNFCNDEFYALPFDFSCNGDIYESEGDKKGNGDINLTLLENINVFDSEELEVFQNCNSAPDNTELTYLLETCKKVAEKNADILLKSLEYTQKQAVRNLNEINLYETMKPAVQFAQNFMKNLTDENEYNLSVKDFEVFENEMEKKEIVIEKATILNSPNVKHTGYVQYAPSPSEIYVCMFVGDSLPLTEILDELDILKNNEKYKRPYFSVLSMPTDDIVVKKDLALKRLGQYALCYSDEENSLSRVQIVSSKSKAKNGLVSVYDLDSGKKSEVSFTKLYPMPDHLKSYPAYAVRCHLANITPTYSELVAAQWDPDDIETMRNWIENNLVITIRVGSEEEKTESVPIIVHDDLDCSCLNVLMANCYNRQKFIIAREEKLKAIQIREQEMKGQVRVLEEKKQIQGLEGKNESILESWDPMLDAYESNMNSYEIDIDDPSCAIYGYVGKDYARLCKEYRETGRCSKRSICRKEHEMLDEKGFTTDKEDIYIEAFNFLRVPNINEELEVLVTNIANGSQFHCVVDECEQSDRETLKSLVKYMNERNNLSKMKKLSVPPALGQIVIARYHEDNSWYRAKVVDVLPEEDVYTVFFVDYGNTETVKFSDIRRIELEYLHLPFQTMFCEIEGIRTNPETVIEAAEYLNEKADGKTTIRILSVLPGERPHLIVQLFDSEGQNVGENLLREKLALPKEHLLLSSHEITVPG